MQTSTEAGKVKCATDTTQGAARGMRVSATSEPANVESTANAHVSHARLTVYCGMHGV